MTDTYNSIFSYKWVIAIIEQQSGSEYKYIMIIMKLGIYEISAKCQIEHLDCILTLT